MAKRVAIAALILIVGSLTVSAQPALDRLESQIQSSPGASGDAVSVNEPAGYLGILADDRRDRGQGVRIVDVVAGGPADRAGLKIGDLITEIDGQAIRNMEEFAAFLTDSRPEQRVSFTLHRGDRDLEHVVTLGHRPSPTERRTTQFGGPPPGNGLPSSGAASSRRHLLGVRTSAITDDVRQFFGLPDNRGALVSEVVAGSPAEKAGLPLDAIIIALDGTPVADPAELGRLVTAAGPGREVELSFYSRGQFVKKKVALGDFAASGSSAAQTPTSGPAATPARAPAPGLEERLRQLEQRIERLEQLLQRFAPPAGPSGESPARDAPARGVPMPGDT